MIKKRLIELSISGNSNRSNPVKINTAGKPKRHHDTSRLNELISYFDANKGKIKAPVRLNDHTIINDVSKFADAEIATLKHNSGNMTFMPSYERLERLRHLLLLTSKK